MFLIRSFLAVIIRIVDFFFAPKLAKLPEAQALKVKEETQSMRVYQFKACPFCVKLRWAMRRMGVDLPFEDAKNDPKAKQELLTGGGKVKVPCLKYEKDGQEKWLYESSDIELFLRNLVQNAR